MNKLIITIFLITGYNISLFGQATKAEPILEKMTYTVKTQQISEKKKGKEEDDEFSFRGGKFKSKLFTEMYRVPTKPYEILDVDTTTGTKIITWQCEAALDDIDKVTFSGKIDGKTITGTAEWTVKNKPKKTLHYEFTGELKEKKKKTPAPAAEK